jgi:hypothetical protein
MRVTILYVFIMSVLGSSRAGELGRLKVLAVHGQAERTDFSQGGWSVAKAGATMRVATQFRTGTNSTIDIGFEKVAAIRLAPGSKVGIDLFRFEPKKYALQLDLRVGRLIVLADKFPAGSIFEIKTPVGVTGVRAAAGFDIGTMNLGRSVWGELVAAWAVIPPMLPPLVIGPNSQFRLGGPGEVPGVFPFGREERVGLSEELESLRQSRLHPAAVLLEGKKGRGIRRTKGDP